jgi:hypothetical protein
VEREGLPVPPNAKTCQPGIHLMKYILLLNETEKDYELREEPTKGPACKEE